MAKPIMTPTEFNRVLEHGMVLADLRLVAEMIANLMIKDEDLTVWLHNRDIFPLHDAYKMAAIAAYSVLCASAQGQAEGVAVVLKADPTKLGEAQQVIWGMVQEGLEKEAEELAAEGARLLREAQENRARIEKQLAEFSDAIAEEGKREVKFHA